MECRIERWKIHIGQHRCVSCVLSIVYDVLLVVGPDGAVEGDSSNRYGGFGNDQGDDNDKVAGLGPSFRF